MKFGRKAPKSLGPHFRFSRYLTARLPPAPAAVDYSPWALPSLRDIMGNDQYGDCVFASANHVQGVVTGNAGALVQATLAQILGQYSAVTGFNPNDPSTDQGTDEVTALNWFCANGFANGVKPLGWVYVDAANAEEVKQAIYLFEHMIFCAGLPDAWVNPMPSGDGFTWGSGTPNPSNGHSFMSFGFDANAKIDTWALFGSLTFPGMAATCTTPTGGGAYCLLTPEMITKGQTKSPAGVAWSDLISDFDAMGGHVPLVAPPTPAPAPAPPPPGTVVTSDMAAAWCTAALNAAHPLLTRGQAEAIVAEALTANWPKP
jgi:hypothetical protein